MGKRLRDANIYKETLYCDSILTSTMKHNSRLTLKPPLTILLFLVQFQLQSILSVPSLTSILLNMAATYQPRPDCIGVANQAFGDVFAGGPYSSLKMVEYLIRKCRVSYSDYVMNPKILERVSAQAIVEDDMYGVLYCTWASKTGRCTFFALKVATLLEQQYPNAFDFKFYDLKGYRVARCRKTGILIDSSSLYVAFELKEGEWKSFEDMGARWKWKSGKSKFERGGRLVRRALAPYPRLAY